MGLDWEDADFLAFIGDFLPLAIGYDEEAIAVEFFGCFDECIEFAFACFLGGEIVAHLD